MSVQFGRWNFEGQPPEPDYIEKVSAALAPYASESSESYCEGGVWVRYSAFDTSKKPRRESQSLSTARGAVIMWDGRLDNRADLIQELRGSVTTVSTDASIVAAACDKWGAGSFAKLIGNWALSIWNPSDRSLILAKDPIGTNHLYYSTDRGNVTWSTILAPLVQLAGKTSQLCEEYVAGWLAIRFPAAHLTPYVGILAVPPSSSVLVRSGSQTVRKYWDFDPTKTIRYRTDAQYEEHFRALFSTAVQRSLRCDRPILAELSGGMDSSSIVCMADTLISSGTAETPRLDSLSWYDGSDSYYDERPYFEKVEEKRGRTGYHIEVDATRKVSVRKSFMTDFVGDHFAATPIPNNPDVGLFRQYAAYMRSQEYRVTLSGIGGEEATGGGVPTPTPELQDLLTRAHIFKFAKQVQAWAAKMGKSPLTIFLEAVRPCFFRSPVHVPRNLHPIPWLASGFVRRNFTVLRSYPFKVAVIGVLPSFQSHIRELNHVRRFLAYTQPNPRLPREIRYPFLDRDLLEFSYAIPPEQHVRVGERRSLMKRALAGIVPREIIHRKRKRAGLPKAGGSMEWPTVREIGQLIIGSSLGVLDQSRVLTAMQKARFGELVYIDSLRHTLTLEAWLRHITIHGVLTR